MIAPSTGTATARPNATTATRSPSPSATSSSSPPPRPPSTPSSASRSPAGGPPPPSSTTRSGGGTSARLLVTADVAGTWTIVVTSRDDLAAGSYDLKIVKDQNALVPTALVEYDFGYDKAGNLLLATEDQAAVAQFSGQLLTGQTITGPAATGLGITTSYTVNALNQVTGYRHLSKADNNTDVVAKRALYKYRGDGSVDTVTRFAGAGVNPIGTSTASLRRSQPAHRHHACPVSQPEHRLRLHLRRCQPDHEHDHPGGHEHLHPRRRRPAAHGEPDGRGLLLRQDRQPHERRHVNRHGNRLLSDGTYRYAYDAEGNRTAKFLDTKPGGTLSAGDTDVTVYAYDQRNRLVAVSHVNAWTSTQAAALAAFNATGTGLPGSDLELRYTYDYADRRIRQSIDADGQGRAPARRPCRSRPTQAMSARSRSPGRMTSSSFTLPRGR